MKKTNGVKNSIVKDKLNITENEEKESGGIMFYIFMSLMALGFIGVIIFMIYAMLN